MVKKIHLFYLIRNTPIDFKNSLHSAFDGMPEYGHIFALAMNKKFYRAIRVDAEVRLFVYLFIGSSLSRYAWILTVVLILGNKHGVACTIDWHRRNAMCYTKHLQIQSERGCQTHSTDGNSMQRRKGNHFFFSNNSWLINVDIVFYSIMFWLFHHFRLTVKSWIRWIQFTERFSISKSKIFACKCLNWILFCNWNTRSRKYLIYWQEHVGSGIEFRIRQWHWSNGKYSKQHFVFG